MLLTSRNYAVGMAHFQIAGGIKSMVGLSGAYVAGATALFGIVLYNVDAGSVPRALRAMFSMLLVVEAFLLVLAGAFRVSGCIRLDASSNMIESHRQMPIEAWRALGGYLIGATAHILAITALNAITLIILTRAVGIPFDGFLLSQIVLGFFAVFIWSFAALNSFMFRQIAPLMVLGVMIGAVSSLFLRSFGILPGLSLLISPFLGESIFSLTGGLLSVRAAYPAALAAQAAFGALFFVGACRRYRGTYLTTFNVPLGIALVAVWSLLSIASIRIWPSLIGSIGVRDFMRQPEAPSQIMASLMFSALLMIVPVHALAMWEARHPVKMGRRALALLGVMAAGLIVMLAAPYEPRPWAISALAMAALVLTLYFSLRAFRIFTPMTMLVLMVTLLLVVWLVPILAEGLLTAFFPNDPDPSVPALHDFTMIGTLSPIGLLMQSWQNPAFFGKGAVGLVVQFAEAGGMWLLGNVLVRRNPEAF